MPYDVEWKQGAIEDVTTLFDYIAENSSLWDAQNVTDRVLAAADKLADFPRLYEVDSRYGEDVRRISLMGQHVLYDVDDQTRKVRVLAVVWPAPESPYCSLITGDGDAIHCVAVAGWTSTARQRFPHGHHRRGVPAGVSAVSGLCSSSLMDCISCRSPATSSLSAFISAINASEAIFSVSPDSLNSSRS